MAVVAILLVLLVATTFETGFLGSSAGPKAVNSPNNPLTGAQLYTAYTSDQSQADASYTNKTIYIQDTLDTGVSVDLGSGQYYSTVAAGEVVLVWNSPSQVDQLSAGSTVLAKCSVVGAVAPFGAQSLEVYLQACDLISTQSQTSTSTSVSVPANSV